MERYASIFRPGLFAGAVVLVTGGGTGIGRCVAHELASLGASVHLAARRAEPLEQTADEIARAGGCATWSQADVRDAEAVAALVAEVLHRHTRLDAVVNNAGGQFPAPAEAITPNGWRSVVDLNLTAAFLVSRAAFTAWMGEHGGAICNVVADVRNGFPGMAHTGAARAGVINLTQTLAVEWAGRRVRVNAVAPGIIWSSGMDTYAPEVRALAVQRGAATPAGRLGTEAEVAAAVAFLLSPGAAYVTGATLPVDGASRLVPQPLVGGAGRPLPVFDPFPLARALPPAQGDDVDRATEDS